MQPATTELRLRHRPCKRTASKPGKSCVLASRGCSQLWVDWCSPERKARLSTLQMQSHAQFTMLTSPLSQLSARIACGLRPLSSTRSACGQALSPYLTVVPAIKVRVTHKTNIHAYQSRLGDGQTFTVWFLDSQVRSNELRCKWQTPRLQIPESCWCVGL
jgi:hypothetical protein